MVLDTWISFIGVTLLFMATPGPSHLLMVSNTLSSGFSKSTATAIGDLTANALQMLAAGLGVSALVEAFPGAMHGILLAGATYIGWLGIVKLRTATNSAGLAAHAKASTLALFRQGFTTSMTNPKAIVFFAALFPAFVDSSQYALQWSILSLTYLVIDGSFLVAYGALATTLAHSLSAQRLVTIEKICGVALICVALAIAINTRL